MQTALSPHQQLIDALSQSLKSARLALSAAVDFGASPTVLSLLQDAVFFAESALGVQERRP